jgi:hypothetical protein
MRIFCVMTWTVGISGRVAKRIRQLPDIVQEITRQLVREIARDGPARVGWPHYGKIAGKPGCHHCHVRRGRPTYVAIWKETGENLVEVTYVGTHEGADYGRLC